MNRVAHIGVACLLVCGLGLLYFEPVVALVRQWNGSPMYSYAFTVPLISLYVLWSRRDAFARQAAKPARLLGALVIAAGLVTLALAQVAAVQVVQQGSLLVVIVGLVLLLFGTGYLKVSAPALGYLIFMIPIWDVFTEPLHWPFQNNSAELGVAILHAIGVPAYREGTVIALSNVTLEVARACSGVNYLVAVLALALPLSYLRLEAMWRRVVLIVSALVISALANGLRVALIGTLAYLEIGSPLHGPFHVLHGLFVAAVGYVALFGGLALLERQESRNAAAAPASTTTPVVNVSWRTGDAFAAAVVFCVLGFVGSPRSTPVVLAMPLEQLPGRLGVWEADTVRPAAAVDTSAWSDADTQLRRRYFRRDGHSATLDVWYFEAQQQNREIVNFRAAGLHNQAATHVVSPRDGQPFTANVVRMPGEVGLFWYVLDGRPEAGQYAAKLRSLWMALTAGHSNGAAVMLRTPVTASSHEAALGTLSELAAEVHVALGRHWHPALESAAPSPTEAR
jgi:EpsI family protein